MARETVRKSLKKTNSSRRRTMAQGADQVELLEDYPDLEPEDIRACIAYGHDAIETRQLEPTQETERYWICQSEIIAFL